ncbi:MAG TPA: sigma-70 family RNA polymerase sigma factor [Steroidobacteraceae bacterium]|nr:sigma-70 family RNA polymerase sigma factor [Steroidobacteraceae bacterium]
MGELRTELVELLPRLRRFARVLARNPHDADDLVQTAIERALAHARQLRADAPLAGWLFGIVRHAWIDEQRSRGRRGRLFAAAEAADEVADPAHGAPLDAIAVQDAVARLPDEQRLAVALVLVEGLSYKEAAHIMEVPIGTLTSRLARARDALQALLGERDGA